MIALLLAEGFSAGSPTKKCHVKSIIQRAACSFLAGRYHIAYLKE